MDPIFYPAVLFVAIGLLIVIAAAIASLRNRTYPTKRFRGVRMTYTPGEFSSQMELDLRLPYRRFKQLYPSSRLTYDEYKRLQMQRAFRRSMSSQDNKRMVR